MLHGMRIEIAVVALALCACDRGSAKEERAMPRSEDPAGKPTDPSAGETRPPGEAAPAAGQAEAAGPREMKVPSSGGEDGAVRVRLPASWSQRAQSIVLENESREAVAGVQFDVVCEKECSDEDISRFGSIVDSTFDTRVRPNVGTGDPKLDAVRLDLALVEEGELPDGRFRVARITRPAGLEGPYREELYAVCVRGKRGGKAMAAQGWVPLAREAELGPLVVEACKTFEIVR
jgi:hypothetical protein